MTTLRHQIASLQPKKFALCFFPLDNSLEPCKTSLIKEGSAREGKMVRLYWDKKNPDLPAKIIFLEDDLKELEKKRNEVLKENFNTSMTAGDKEFIETWKKKHVKMPTKRPVQKHTESKSADTKKKATCLDLGKLPVVTTSQEIVSVADESNNISPVNSPVTAIRPLSPLTNLATTSASAVPSVSSASSVLPATVVSYDNLSTASPIIPSSSILHSTVSSSFTALPSSYSSNIHPVVSIPNHNRESILPTITSPLASVPRSLATSNNIFSVLPLVSSFDSTVQSSLPTLSSNLQPVTPVTLGLTSDNNIPYSTFLSELHAPSFSPESTNSNAFSLSWNSPSLNNLSFDSVGQSEPRVSTPVQSGLPAGFLEEINFPRSRSPNNFENILPGHAEHPPILNQIHKKMDGIFQKVDAVLANQRLIIDCLQNNGFLNRPSTRSSVPEAAEQNRINFTNPPDESQHYGAENVHVHGRELTMAELDALNLKKKRGTTDAYFAVLLLKEYTTPEERINCTVYGAGPKSKGLNTNTLMKIKKGYEHFYSNESWGDAIKAMNNHMRKYCSAKDPE